MERPMTEWNEDRLDELNERVKLCATKEEMNLRFDAVDQQFSEVDKRLDRLGDGLDRLNDRFDRLLHTLIAIPGASPEPCSPRRSALSRSFCSSPGLLPRHRRRSRIGALFAELLAGDVVLGEEEVVAGALDDVQQVAHQ